MRNTCADKGCFKYFDDDFQMDGKPRVRGPKRRFCSVQCQKHTVNDAQTQRRRTLKRCYGMTLEQFDALFESQDGVCAICGNAEETVHRNTGTKWNLNVDHNHDTGEVRGLLCTPCNRGIGFLRDSPQLLLSALAYLTR